MLKALRPSGFTLVEIVVAIAIMAIMASVIAPSLIAFADRKRAETAAAMLEDVRVGLVGANGFRAKVGKNAGKISQLTNRITAGNAAIDDDSCGNAYKAADQTPWDGNAPFVPYMISRNGFATPIGTAEDTLNRNPNTNSAGVTVVVFKNVDLRDVLLLDDVIDAGDGIAAGLVQWQASPLIMGYIIPVDNKC
jgi:prepilin-type N-terminal cleavage/methylation domain-containing protein